MNRPNFLVRVECITFNHSKFITDAMNGFCMQQTDFPFVCCIVDDASTDGEQQVVKEYLQQNFDLSEESSVISKETENAFVTFACHKKNKNCYFAVFYLKENHFSEKKSKDPYFDVYGKDCKYIALCEGDDYWISKDKLQKQIEVLQRYNSCSMVCTRTRYFSQRQMRYVSENRCLKKTGFLECKNVILRGGEYISTASICFKKEVLDNYPLYCRKCYIGDYPLQIMCAMKGKVYYIDEKMTVYRMDNVLSWCGREASAIDVYSVEKYKRKLTLQDMLYGFSQDYPRYCDFFMKRIAFSINNEITRHISKKVAKNILYFYNKYIDEFKWNWRIDLMMRLYIPQKVLGVYTKIVSLLCYRKFYKK